LKSIPLEHWTKSDAESLYGINNWGADYFSLSDQGEVEVVVPTESGESRVAFKSIIDAMRDSCLNKAFAKAIREANYQNVYRGVFPIKVNQQHQVIQEISYFGSRYNHGLEAGSKAELIIALAHITDDDSYIICNGYKDAEFIDLGLHAIKLGVKCFFVIETPSEVPTIIARSQALGIRPILGVRLKLASKVDGHWSEDSGDRSIFGLNTIQLMSLMDELKQADMLDCLQLIHFHLGSQIPNIRNIRSGMLEACRYYVELVKEGVPLQYMDLGGGLAVDYDGSQSSDAHSMNYGLSEYCSDVVEAIMESLDPLNIPHPVIITESGRATIAYSSVLLFNILDVSHFDPSPSILACGSDLVCDSDQHEMVGNLIAVSRELQSKDRKDKSLNVSRLQESYNDVIHYRDELRELFRRGQVSLRERAIGENSFLVAMQGIVNALPALDRIPAELESLGEELADIYYGNSIGLMKRQRAKPLSRTSLVIVMGKLIGLRRPTAVKNVLSLCTPCKRMRNITLAFS